MKNKTFTGFILAASLLTGCGQEVASPTLQDTVSESVVTTALTTQVTEVSKTIPANACTTPPTDITVEITDTLEVYDDVAIEDVISMEEIELVNGEELIDTSEVGEHEAEIRYVYGDKLYCYPISYSVADTTPPLLLSSGAGSQIELYDSFDINDFVGFADNYDKDPEIEYTGYVDTTSPGTYYLEATATDKYSNETSWELDVTVTEEIPVPVDDNTRIPFEDYVAQYDDGNVTFGIDVSRWQGDIDFEAVKNAGCEFVIMRIGSYYDEYTLDSCYTQNMQAAKRAGLDVGVYIYTTANTEDEIKENAQWVAEQLGDTELDFPVVFDWEEFYNFQQYNMSINDLNEYFELFADEMKSYGYDAMLYSSKNFLCNFWYEYSDYPIWLAHYIDETTYEGEYAIWQSTCFGKIDGIEGDVDFNILYDDKMK